MQAASPAHEGAEKWVEECHRNGGRSSARRHRSPGLVWVRHTIPGLPVLLTDLSDVCVSVLQPVCHQAQPCMLLR